MLLGMRIEVLWDDGIMYPGTVMAYSARTRKHT
jgi:hypothetical protein